jgi:EAL domain-containing protein (putative c-di-GMP-specific phosphodiesterase class I)
MTERLGRKDAVNLSPAQLRSRAFVFSVVSALEVSHLAATRLELEITETVLLQNTEAILQALHQIRDLGVRIAMDDLSTCDSEEPDQASGYDYRSRYRKVGFSSSLRRRGW